MNILKITVLATLIICLMISGCAPIQSSLYSSDNQEGFPYYLPKSFIKLTIESKKDSDGKHEELLVATNTELVADSGLKVMLNSAKGPWSATKHTFTSDIGLLTSVATEDDGKVGEVIEMLAGIGISALKFNMADLHIFEAMSKKQQAMEEGCTETDPLLCPDPTPSEIRDLLNLVQSGKHELIFEHKSVRAVPLPGTANIIIVGIDPEPTAPQIRAQATIDLQQLLLEPYDGILSRTLEPQITKVAFHINYPEFFRYRLNIWTVKKKKAEKNLKENAKEIAEVEGYLENSTGKDRENYTKKLEGLKKDSNKQKKISKQADLVTSKAREFFDSSDKLEPYHLETQEFVLQVPDYSPVVKIPIRSASLGKSKNTISLYKGIVTEQATEHPSQILEIIKIPARVAEAIIKIPAEIIQLKIDYSSNAEELAEKKKSRREKENELESLDAKLQRADAEIQEQLERHNRNLAKEFIENERDIIKLQQEIATIKKEMSGTTDTLQD
jgi:hypothetical protein